MKIRALSLVFLMNFGTAFGQGIGQIGFLSSPTGGNSSFSVTLSPTLFLRAGIAF